MNILEIIEKKRDKKELTDEEIKFFIKGYTSGEIADYQAAALIMAIYINGMTDKESTNLTMELRRYTRLIKNRWNNSRQTLNRRSRR